MWHWVLDNNPKSPASIIQNMDGKKLMYMPTPVVPAYNASFPALVESNGDVKLLSM